MSKCLLVAWLLLQSWWVQAAGEPTFTLPCQKLEASLAGLADPTRELAGGWRVMEIKPVACAENNGGPAVKLGARGDLVSGWPEVELRAEWLVLAEGKRLRKQLEGALRAASAVLAWARNQAGCRRFISRYGLNRVLLLRPAGSAGWLLRLWSRRLRGEHTAYLELEHPARDPVRAYAVAGVAGFPVRRELLRLAEQVSDRLPACRVGWATARRLPEAPAGQPEPGAGPGTQPPPLCPPKDPDCLPDRWQVVGRLAGPACPLALGVIVDQRLQVTDSVVYHAASELPWAPPR